MLNELYEKELKELRKKMEKAEEFANKLPCLKDIILKNKYAEDMTFIDFGNYYKNIYLGWGITRHFYKNKNQITNYRGENPNRFLFNIYVNTFSLYDSNNDYGLDELVKEYVYFNDELNSTFYVEDEHIGQFLEELSKWIVRARKLAEEDSIKKEKENLKRRLKELEGDKNA